MTSVGLCWTGSVCRLLEPSHWCFSSIWAVTYTLYNHCEGLDICYQMRYIPVSSTHSNPTATFFLWGDVTAIKQPLQHCRNDAQDSWNRTAAPALPQLEKGKLSFLSHRRMGLCGVVTDGRGVGGSGGKPCEGNFLATANITALF